MRVPFLLALLCLASAAAADLNIIQCAQMAQQLSSCVANSSTTSATGSYFNPMAPCCPMVPNFVNTCGGQDVVIANRFFLTDYLAQQRLVNSMFTCKSKVYCFSVSL